MQTYVIWCRSGKRYFKQASCSIDAIGFIEHTFAETVSSWDVAASIPAGATLL